MKAWGRSRPRVCKAVVSFLILHPPPPLLPGPGLDYFVVLFESFFSFLY